CHTIALQEASDLRRITGEFILVATGSVPYRPSDIPFDDPDIDDSDSILEIDRMPDSLLVMGGGVIGCEYASVFAAMGVKVTLVEPRDELLSFLDADISEALRLALVRFRVDVHLKTSVVDVKRSGGSIVSRLTPAVPPGVKPPPGEGKEVATDKFLFA